MVQTRAAAKRAESGQGHSNNGAAVKIPSEPCDTKSPVKTRRRDGGESSKKRRRGKPGELCQLNLDVLFLIAAYVHPIDLLNLARTCKSLRELLMSKSSGFIWRNSRRQVDDLPDCPADLTEPEYANLLFYARCHGCGRRAEIILWNIRRRYCPGCRAKRLCSLSSCHGVIRNYSVLASEHLTIGNETTQWVDKEHMDSFMREYNRSSDKKQFLSDKRKQHSIIANHAHQCVKWKSRVASARRIELQFRRWERENSIFERLKQHGYDPEVTYFGHQIPHSYKSFFNTSRRLTDKEWSQMWPELSKTMKNFRARRLDMSVYQPRRRLLASEYARYVKTPSPNTPALDILPNEAELSRFPTFQELIRAPESTPINAESFEPAFAQLPMLVDEWRKNLDAELADLVKIPSHLSFNGASSSKTPSQVATDKLHIACAVFKSKYIFAYPDVLHVIHPCLCQDKVDQGPIPSLQDRFNITFLEDAPYIVRACGLDPHVAMVEDMDRQNARVRCLSCRDPRVRTWQDALAHASAHHSSGQPPSLQWERIGDEHIDAIQAAELSIEKGSFLGRMRCLLCHPCVGDAQMEYNAVNHIVYSHKVPREDIKQGVHYVRLRTYKLSSVEMVEEGGCVTFKP